MSHRSSYSWYDELNNEEMKLLVAAKNHLSKTDDEENAVDEGFQLFNSLANDLQKNPTLFCQILKESMNLILKHLKSQRYSIIQSALSSITLWTSICKESFEGVSISLWPGLVDCCISSRKKIATETEKTMVSIIQSTSHFSSLFSSLLSLFYSSNHNTARFVLMKCVGEMIRCWSMSFIVLKRDDIIQLVLTGVKDRAGEVRDASRIVLCLYYCRIYPSHHDFPTQEDLSNDEVLSCLNCLLTTEQQNNLSHSAFDLLCNELKEYHHKFITTPSFLSKPIQWPEITRQTTPVISRTIAPSSPIAGTSKRVLFSTSTPVKKPQRIKNSLPSPIPKTPTSRIISSTNTNTNTNINSVRSMENETPDQLLNSLCSLPMASQVDILKHLKQLIESKHKSSSTTPTSPSTTVPISNTINCTLLLEKLTICLHSSFSRVSMLCLEVIELYIRYEFTHDIMEKNESIIISSIKKILVESFMNSENPLSSLVHSLLATILQFQCIAFLSHLIQFLLTYLHSFSSYLTCFLFQLIQDYSLPSFPSSLYSLLIDCSYQAISLHNPQVDQAVKKLLTQLNLTSPVMLQTNLSQSSTSRRSSFAEFIKQERLSIPLTFQLKTTQSSPIIQSRVQLTKPRESGDIHETSQISELYSESTPSSLHIPEEGNQSPSSQVQSILLNIQNGQYLKYSIFWDYFHNPNLTSTYPCLFTYWVSQLPKSSQHLLVQQIFPEIQTIFQKEGVSPVLFSRLTVFYSIIRAGDKSLSIPINQIRDVLLACIRCPFASYRMIGYSIIKYMLSFLDKQRVQEYICNLSEEEQLVLSSFTNNYYCLFLLMQALTKTEIRKVMNKILRNIAPESRLSQSKLITSQISALKEFKDATSIAMYLSMKTEVDTEFIMEECFRSGKSVLVPKIISDCEFELVSLSSQSEVEGLPKDKWGIPIPPYEDSNRMIFHPEKTPEVILVPGVAFDANCKRMGHGKGYYDRYFAFLKEWCSKHQKSYPILIGIAFTEQIVEDVPCSEYDVPLDMIITPNCIYRKYTICYKENRPN